MKWLLCVDVGEPSEATGPRAPSGLYGLALQQARPGHTQPAGRVPGCYKLVYTQQTGGGPRPAECEVFSHSHTSTACLGHRRLMNSVMDTSYCEIRTLSCVQS